MSTATTATDLTLPLLSGRYHFLLRRLHSLSGITFGGYLFIHLIVNGSIAQLGDVYQLQVARIHELPFLSGIEWTFIYLPILFHMTYGVWITLTGQPNVERYSYGRNWLYIMQRVTAIILIFFILFHVLALKYGLFGAALTFDPNRASVSIHQHMTAYWWLKWIVYPVGVLAACFHLANGYWAAAISWGLTVSAGAQRRWGYVCLAAFFVAFTLGMTAIVAAATIIPTTSSVARGLTRIAM